MRAIENRYFKSLSFPDKVLYLLSCYDSQLDMSGYDYILTTGTAARLIERSQYKVRKVLKQFEEQGLVKRVCKGGCSDEELAVWCKKGWHITPKVRYTDIFKRANWEESKIMRECWQIVPSQYYATNTSQWHEGKRKFDEEFEERMNEN